MNPVVRVTVPLVVAAAAALALFSAWRSNSESYQARLERAQLKREFLERASVSREIAADKQKEWRDEVRALLRWYFDELAAIRNRHPRVPPREPEAPKGAKKEEVAARAEWQKYAEERLALLRDGKYEPLWSLADRGLRFDILSFEAARNPEGGARGIRIDFALWGAPRRVEKETTPGTVKTVSRVIVPVAFRQIAFEFLDDKGKVFGGMEGPGEPDMKLSDPERFSDDFPPGVLFGTRWVELFPREAVKTVMAAGVEARGQAGTDVSASYRLELPVRTEWKLGEGEAFKAETREAAQ